MIGLRVGPFEIVESAEVPEPGDWYFARRSGMSQRKPSEVLVRVLPPDADAELRADLQRCFDNLRQVEHARVPIAVAMYEGIGAMAITAVRGTSLQPVVRARATDEIPMSPATLLDLLLEVAEILQFAHHRGRPHGHLEPRHLVVAPDGTVWVLGFAAGATTEPDPHWAPPERARGEAATEATDQWSLGALGSALITGRVPWPGDDPLSAARSGSPEALIDPVEHQWPALARLLRKLLDNRPANRFPTMHQVRQELLALARKAGGTSARRELGAQLNQVESLVDTEAGAPERLASTPALVPRPTGDTLTPPEAVPPSGDESEDADEEVEPEVEVEVEVEESEEELSPEAPTPSPAPRALRASEPEIQVARTVAAGAGPSRGAGTPLPAEQIPVVRPELDGETFGSGAAYSDPGSSAFDDPARVAFASSDQGRSGGGAFDSVVDPSDVDSALNLSPHPDHDPKSVADPPSLPVALGQDFVDEEVDAADYEATVLYTAAALAEEQGEFAISDSTGEVEVQVEYTDESEVPPTPTLSPTTDSDMHSEEVPRPQPQKVPTRPLPVAAHPASDAGIRSAGRHGPSQAREPEGYLPSKVPDSVGHEPELGSIHGDISIRNEPVFSDEDVAVRPSELPPPASTLPQRIAVGAVGLLVLAMLIWAVTQLF